MAISTQRLVVVAATAIVTAVPSTGLAFNTLTTELVAAGLPQPVFVTAPPGDSTRLLVVEQRGRIRILLNDQLLATPFLNIEALVLSGGESGLLGMAFHPNYAANGLFYVNYTDSDGNTVIARYTRSADPNVADPASAATIMTLDQPFGNHNGGCLLFGPKDNFLYIPTGDGGSAGDPFGNGQNLGTRLGKILRIDVDGAFPFAIPPGNPFAAGLDPAGAALDEIWAYGLRNPWRCSFDRQTGDFYIADVGQSDREEINFRPGSAAGGENYGWKIKEGSACFDDAADCATPGLTDPLLDYG
ncbi:MAG: PQQ-dependent sugar dehydrogenase, partial [Planctomycetota bacterium]|nr:PQQ-dependent sugar dehydrogenase [Planctomycetota bacterium]